MQRLEFFQTSSLNIIKIIYIYKYIFRLFDINLYSHYSYLILKAIIFLFLSLRTLHYDIDKEMPLIKYLSNLCKIRKSIFFLRLITPKRLLSNFLKYYFALAIYLTIKTATYQILFWPLGISLRLRMKIILFLGIIIHLQ